MTEPGIDSLPAGFPAVHAMEKTGDGLCISLSVPDGLCWFDGHFPGFPVLPGVIQLHWAVHFSQQLLEAPGAPHTVKRLKFSHVVLPGAALQLTLLRGEANDVRFDYRSDQAAHSQGRIVFGSERPGAT